MKQGKGLIRYRCLKFLSQCTTMRHTGTALICCDTRVEVGYCPHPSSDAMPCVAQHPPQTQRCTNSRPHQGHDLRGGTQYRLDACDSQPLVDWRYNSVPANCGAMQPHRSGTWYAIAFPGAAKRMQMSKPVLGFMPGTVPTQPANAGIISWRPVRASLPVPLIVNPIFSAVLVLVKLSARFFSPGTLNTRTRPRAT